MYSFKSLHARNILRKVSLSDGKDKLPVVCNTIDDFGSTYPVDSPDQMKMREDNQG